MKLAVTSDLHLPITPASVIIDLAAEIAGFAPQAVVLAGDLGESLPDVQRCLQLFKGLMDCPILVLAGNHDLWIPLGYRGLSSQALWGKYLPELVEQAGCTWFEGQAFIADGVAVAGTIAWYDYSGVDPSINASAETFAREKQYFNPDGLRIDWPWTDPQFAGMVSAPFLATLDQLESNPAVQQTVVVTHVPLLDCQMCRKPENRDWSFSNAYFGNLTLGDQVLQRKKVTHIISGHTHVGRESLVKLTDGRTIHAWVLDSRCSRPAWLGITLPEMSS